MTKSMVLTLAIVASLLIPTAVVAESYYIPLPVYRTGPYAPGGIGYFGGVIDYFTLLNERDGGIGGVKIVWDECETEYDRSKGAACYQRQKRSRFGDALYFDPLSVDISSALIEQGRRDKVPIISVNHGRTETERGDVFPYQFPLGSNAYDFANVAIKYMGAQMGGMDKLKGETIVTLHHGSAYGREANQFLNALGEVYGFRHEPIEVPHPGNEQSAQWLQIRKLKPAYVFLRGWGVMNPVAIQAAVRNGYGVSELIGNEWSNSDEDVIPAGQAADGYRAVTVQRAGKDYPLAAEIIAELYNRGKGNLEYLSHIGSTYWNLGVWSAVMAVEAIRLAQRRFGKVLNGEHIRWGFENIDLTRADLERMGMAGVVPPIKVTCRDHAAVHLARFQQWDAQKREWRLLGDWIDAASDLSRRLVDRDTDEYVRAHPGLLPRDCENSQERDDFDL